LQGTPVLPLPGIGVVQPDIPVLLPSLAAPGMTDGDVHHMLSLVRADIAAIAIRLFLVIVFHFPYYIMLHYGRKGCNIRAVSGVEEEFHWESLIV
jgi:hypothetical protein